MPIRHTKDARSHRPSLEKMDFAQLEEGKEWIDLYAIVFPAEFYVPPRCLRRWPICLNNVFIEHLHFTIVVLTYSARLKYVTGKPHVPTQGLRRYGSYNFPAYTPELSIWKHWKPWILPHLNLPSTGSNHCAETVPIFAVTLVLTSWEPGMSSLMTNPCQTAS